MTTDTQPIPNRLLPITFAGLFAVIPLIWPGIWDTSSDLVGKRITLCVFGCLICILWLVTQSKTKYKSSPLVLPATLYVSWNVFSLAWTTNPFTAWVEALQLCVMLTLFLALVQTNITRHVTILAQAIATSGLIVSLIGIAQYLGVGFSNILSVGLPSSTFIFRNLAAAYLLGAIPMCVLAFLYEKNRSLAMLWFLSLCAMLLFMFYTRTRGAWISLATSAILTLVVLFVSPTLRQWCLQALKKHWVTQPTRWFMILCTILLLAGATRPAYTSPRVIQQFDEKKSSATTAVTSLLAPGSDRGRLSMWTHTTSMFFDHPILGVGLDNWEYIYPLYDKGDKITSDSEPVRPHNDILWIASELGLIGIGLYVFLLIATARLGLKQIRQKDPSISPLIALMGLAALLIYSLFSFPKEQPVPTLFFWLFLALLATPHSPPTKSSKMLPILGFAICICTLYTTTRQRTFDIAYHRARAYEVHNQLPYAYKEITRALQAGSFDHRARFLKAQYLQKMGRNAQATTAYLEALQAHPNYAHSYHNLGGTYAAQKKFPQAIEAYKQALSLRPSYFQAHLHLGNAYATINQVDLAIQAFGKAIKAKPSFAEAHTNLGALYLRKKQPNRAITAFQEAIRLQPTNAQAHNNLAYTYEQAGQISKAIEAYQKVLQHWTGANAYRETVRKHIVDLRNQSREN